jgi:hypothetical protein
MDRRHLLADDDIIETMEQDDDILIMPFYHESLLNCGYYLTMSNTIFHTNNDGNNDKNIIDPWENNCWKTCFNTQPILIDAKFQLNPGQQVLTFTNEFVYVQGPYKIFFDQIDQYAMFQTSVICYETNYLSRLPLIVINNGKYPILIDTTKPIIKCGFYSLSSDGFYPKTRIVNLPTLEWLYQEWSPTDVFDLINSQHNAIKHPFNDTSSKSIYHSNSNGLSLDNVSSQSSEIGINRSEIKPQKKAQEPGKTKAQEPGKVKSQEPGKVKSQEPVKAKGQEQGKAKSQEQGKAKSQEQGKAKSQEQGKAQPLTKNQKKRLRKKQNKQLGQQQKIDMQKQTPSKVETPQKNQRKTSSQEASFSDLSDNSNSESYSSRVVSESHSSSIYSDYQ